VDPELTMENCTTFRNSNVELPPLITAAASPNCFSVNLAGEKGTFNTIVLASRLVPQAQLEALTWSSGVVMGPIHSLLSG
jgi:diphthamide synthase (EF-2-diphthine--ammonia ligase)